MAGGRKSAWSSYIEPRLAEIEVLAQTNTDENIADILGIHPSTFYKYKAEKSELFDAIKRGRCKLVADLKNTLIQKAKGFSYQETKEVKRIVGEEEVKTVETYTKYAQPDTAAIHLLLKNYDDTWKNDDASTLELKRKHIEIEQQKADDSKWH